MLKKTQYDMPKFKSLMNQIKDQRKGLLNTWKVINQMLKSRQNLHMQLRKLTKFQDKYFLFFIICAKLKTLCDTVKTENI